MKRTSQLTKRAAKKRHWEDRSLNNAISSGIEKISINVQSPLGFLMLSPR